MPVAEPISPALLKQASRTRQSCYHCGTACLGKLVSIEEKAFCCEGCKLVYEILNSNGLCDYYKLENHPGLSGIKALRQDKYAYLDHAEISEKLCSFTSAEHSVVRFYIPGMHCSSCMWLLEHLRRLHEGIAESRLNFSTKEVTIHFSPKQISLRQIVELLTTIGYEPAISLKDGDHQETGTTDRSRLYKLGIAGFCFTNIMMISFAEYLGGDALSQQFAGIFRGLILLLALPVFFYSASEFFGTAWKGIRAKTLNIDAPIALAILITFSRSLYEILSSKGAGYLDSMTGIVFFMLVGRVVQERTYRSISFHRDYKSYFPIAVTVLTSNGPETCSLHDLKEGDIVQLHNDEIIPADSIVKEGAARIDYSFVTGESEPLRIAVGEKLYAGGRQTGERLTIQIIKPVAGSYLTALWNHHAFTKNKTAEARRDSSIQTLSRYFTMVLFAGAIVTGLYWALHDPSKILNSITAMLIVACPCALLLSSTFTNGNLLRIFSNNGLFLRDATVIEQLGRIDYIAFDKTGTLTQGTTVQLLDNAILSEKEASLIFTATQSSRHPYSKALTTFTAGTEIFPVDEWEEIPGQGIQAVIHGILVKVGNAAFTGALNKQANVHVAIGGMHYSFLISPQFRTGTEEMMDRLQRRFQLSLLSGDNARQKRIVRNLFGAHSTLLFHQKPMDKLSFIERMQAQGHKVLMIGDGLNDAGALQQSNAGITLADDVNNFTPSCDAILDARRFRDLPSLLGLARAGRSIITVSFAISILYNLAGLFFAVQGKMNPMIAAILMPASTLSIVLISTGMSALAARLLGLQTKT